MKKYTLVKVVVTRKGTTTEARDVTALLAALDKHLDAAFRAACSDRDLGATQCFIEDAVLNFMDLMGYLPPQEKAP